MRQMIPFLSHSWPYVCAFAWGVFWAVILQYTPIGRFLAARRTWITVVIGVGVVLLIALGEIPINWWLRFAALILLSSIGIIARSLRNERQDEQEVIDAAKAALKNDQHLGV